MNTTVTITIAAVFGILYLIVMGARSQSRSYGFNRSRTGGRRLTHGDPILMGLADGSLHAGETGSIHSQHAHSHHGANHAHPAAPHADHGGGWADRSEERR